MSDKMREAFEAWAKATTGWDLYPFGTDQYADHKTNAAWFAWQAALAQAEQRGGVSGWYCAHCQHGVDPVDVTFGETHVYCGYPVTDCPAPPAPVVPDDVAKDAARYLWLRDQARNYWSTRELIDAFDDLEFTVDRAMLASAPEVKP